MSSQPAQLGAGAHLNLPEEDYLYGSGRLQLVVTRVHDSQPVPDWLQVSGVEILWNGDRGNDRTVFVRRTALAQFKAGPKETR